MNEIKFPIAIYKPSGKPIDITDVTSGAECNCICFECREALVAINKDGNKQSDHFRHHPGSKCGANFESFFHWLAKEVICSSETFTLPEIPSEIVLESSEREFEVEIQKIFKKYNVPEPFRKSYKYKFILQESQSIKINSSAPEVIFNTNRGLIKVDVKIECQGNNLLIEPFFTHPIDEIKRKKIIDLDETVLVINLQAFGPAKGYNFSLKNFRSSIIHGKNLKSWAHIKRKKIKSLQKVLLNRIEEQLSNSKEFFSKFEDFDHKIADEKIKLIPIEEELKSIEKQLVVARKKIWDQLKIINSIKEDRNKFGNSFLKSVHQKPNSDPWHLRSFDD